MNKSLAPMKATVIDDDAFRLLAFPFGGPLPSKANPRGEDIDHQWFSERTDIKPDWFPFRIVDWNHRQPGDRKDRLTPTMVLGKAILDDELTDEEGWWVTVWLKHGERRVELVKTLAERGAQLFGSSETAPGMGRVRTTKGEIVPWRRDVPGEIVAWPYLRQTLSTSPQNTLSVLRPMKATLDDLAAYGERPAQSFFDDLASYLDNLVASDPADLSGDAGAKAGRVLAARNEARLREARDLLEDGGWHPLRRKQAIALFSELLDELERYIRPPD